MPRPGAPVGAFGVDGFSVTGFPDRPHPGGIQEMDVRPDGSMIVLGNAAGRFVLARFEPDGTPDPGYGSGGYATGRLSPDGRRFYPGRLAVLSDGSSVLGGDGDRFQTGVLVRYDKHGHPDHAFGTGGIVRAPLDVKQLGVDSDDRLVVVGSSGSNTTVSRYRPDGRPDLSFGTDGSVTHRFYGSSGFSDISMAGDRITINSPKAILRLREDGSLDESYGTDGYAPGGDQAIQATSVQPDGSLFLAGGSTRVMRLDPHGSVDSGYGDGGMKWIPGMEVYDISVDGLGRVVGAGTDSYNGPASPRDFRVFRLTTSGQLDPAFGGDGVVDTAIYPVGEETFYSVSASGDGSVLAAGTARGGWSSDFAIARYLPDGELDPSFGSGEGFVAIEPMAPPADQITDSTFLEDGRILAVGRSGDSAGIARYRRGGKLDSGFGTDGRVTMRFTDSPFGDAPSSVVAMPGGAFAVCSSSNAGAALAKFRADGSLEPGFAADGILDLPDMRRCGSLLLDEDGRLLAGGVDRDNVIVLSRLLPDGTADPGFHFADGTRAPSLNPSGGGYRALHLALAANGDILMAGNNRGVNVYRLDGDGRPRTGFGKEGIVELDGLRESPFRMGGVNAIDVARGGRIVLGGVDRKGLAVAKLTPGGAAVKAFGDGGIVRRELPGKSAFRDVKVQRNGRIVAAGSNLPPGCSGFTEYCDERIVVARIGSRGKFDRSFGRKGIVVRKFTIKSGARSLLLGKRGVTISGFAETAGGGPDFMLHRLHN